MLMTYTDIKNDFLDATQNSGSTDTTLIAFFKRRLSSAYQFILGELQDYQTQVVRNASTVATQQFYHYPSGLVTLENATVTVGSIPYPIAIIQSQRSWDMLNELLISTTTIPQFIFPRRDDFGIWPIPQAAYTITLNYNIRDRSLTNDDYTTGTVTVTNNSQTVAGSGTTWTAAMIGRWFESTTDGYPYRIQNVGNTTSLTLETSFEGTTNSSQAYRIGEAPEMPIDAHELLPFRCISDYFSMVRSDIERATWFNNMFWTGDGATKPNAPGANEAKGGLIGLKNRYMTRGNTVLVKHMTPNRLNTEKLWGQSITSS